MLNIAQNLPSVNDGEISFFRTLCKQILQLCKSCKQIVKFSTSRLTFRFFVCKIKSSSRCLTDFTHTIFPSPFSIIKKVGSPNGLPTFFFLQKKEAVNRQLPFMFILPGSLPLYPAGQFAQDPRPRHGFADTPAIHGSRLCSDAHRHSKAPSANSPLHRLHTRQCPYKKRRTPPPIPSRPDCSR